MLLKRSFFAAIALLMAGFIAACGSSTGNTNTVPTSAPTATASSASVMIKTATATIKGKAQTILTNADGMTLYYFTADTATTAACATSCIKVWPPLLASGAGSPASADTLSGKLSVLAGANGNQVEYNGHPLYSYSGDTVAGQTHGEGLFGKWFVATPDLSSQGGGSSGGGYKVY